MVSVSLSTDLTHTLVTIEVVGEKPPLPYVVRSLLSTFVCDAACCVHTSTGYSCVHETHILVHEELRYVNESVSSFPGP